MKQTYNTVNYEWLTHFTGDPFADAGGYALKEFSKQNPDLDILEIIMKATEIYVERWKAKINPFFLNSKITQPAFNSSQKISETRKYFLSLLDGTASHIFGVCRITGQKTELFPAGRDNSVLSGSGTFVNFHHSFQDGIMLSKEALIRFHFLPLACEYLQGMVSVIHSNNEQIAEYFGVKCCKDNLSAIGKNISDGILKSKSNSPGTSLFRFIDYVLNKKDELALENNNNLVSMYHFTNFGASPEVRIYTLPFEAFDFYRYMQKVQFKQQWNLFVDSYYIADKEHKKAKFNKKDDVFVYNDNKSSTIVQESDYRFWRNIIYDRLISDQSIIPQFLKRSRGYKLNFEIIKIYAIIIRKMKKETISKIEQMADFILSSNDEQGIKKAIKKLDGAKNSYLLRRFVLKDIVAKYYNEGNQEAIITIDDYADYLFPDTNSWQETRDVLLIAIYQKLHEKNLIIDTELTDDEEDSENSNEQ